MLVQVLLEQVIWCRLRFGEGASQVSHNAWAWQVVQLFSVPTEVNVDVIVP